MFLKLKSKLDFELEKFIKKTARRYALDRVSPLLYKSIENFVLRDGKRIRPILFIIGYLGFSKKPASNLYKSAISFELLHDFLLIHDDIIDKSDTRRGKPSMHKMMDNFLLGRKNTKFTGNDIAIVVGDIIYAMAIEAFLSINEDNSRKENALKKFIEAAIFTGSGEFIELILSLKNIEQIKKEDIYKVYDYKTAYYTFASPLTTGATLAGADKKQISNLQNYGIYLGRAFQIYDDILGMFSEESKTGKSSLTDLQEAKKTILIWYAYKNSNHKNQAMIKKLFLKKAPDKNDLNLMRDIIEKSGALDYARQKISILAKKAEKFNLSSSLPREYKTFLSMYPRKLFKED